MTPIFDEVWDKNSLIDVYAEYLVRNRKMRVYRLGHLLKDTQLGIYLIYNPRTDRYCVFSTNRLKLEDKRQPDITKRYKKATEIRIPVEPENAKLSANIMEEVCNYCTGSSETLTMYVVDNFEFVEDYLEMP